MKRIIPLILSAIYICAMTVSATYNKDIVTIAKKSEREISPGLVFSDSIELFGKERQEIYSFEFTPGSSTKIVPAYGQYIYGFNSVGQLISSYDGDGRVVGGINTDFFITSTGIPLSCLVSNKEVISTCETRAAIGFDKDGNGLIGYPNLSAKLVSEDKELPVAHINKVPSKWGMYLVTDTFYSSTKSSMDSIEIVLKPFDLEKTYPEDNLKDSEQTDIDNNLSSPSTELPQEENNFDINESPDYITEQTNANNISSDDSSNKDFSENTLTNDDTDDLSENQTESETETNNTPEDNELSLSEEEKQKILQKYVFTSQNPDINSEIDVVVTEIFDGVQNSTIEKDSFVLCVPKEQFGYQVENVKIGDEFKLCIASSDDFKECENIFGAGSIIIKDGEFVPQGSDGIFYTKNPRTAAGIRPDGSVLFVCVDGRRQNKSEGLTIRELADYLIDAGCTYAVNFDGGGSTTFYAADIGEVSASLKNTPSAGSERKVADGMLFVNTAEPNGIVTYGSIYPSEFFVFNKDAQQIIDGNILFADEYYYPVDYSDRDISISVDKDYGVLVDSVFTPNGTVGKAEIIASLTNDNGFVDYTVGYINVVESVNEIDIKADNTYLTPFDIGTNVNIDAYLNTIPVSIAPYSADWSISVERITDEGEITLEDVGTQWALFDVENMLFVPFVKGEKYYLTAKIGEYSENIEIYVDEFPYDDMHGHWAAQTSYDMFKYGFITGETDSNNIRNFVPDRYITRAEFCVVLARILGLEIQPEIPEYDNIQNSEIYNDEELLPSETASNDTIENNNINFSDVPQWASAYAKALYEAGYIDSLLITAEDGTITINASEYITRNDVIKILGALIKDDENISDNSNSSGENTSIIEYPDYIPETEDDIVLFQKIINSEIITGYEDGTIRQNLSLTRAEAATVFSRFFSVLKKQLTE